MSRAMDTNRGQLILWSGPSDGNQPCCFALSAPLVTTALTTATVRCTTLPTPSRCPASQLSDAPSPSPSPLLPSYTLLRPTSDQQSTASAPSILLLPPACLYGTSPRWCLSDPVSALLRKTRRLLKTVSNYLLPGARHVTAHDRPASTNARTCAPVASSSRVLRCPYLLMLYYLTRTTYPGQCTRKAMLVPSSFKYSSAAMDSLNQQSTRRSVLQTPYSAAEQSRSPASAPLKRTVTEPVSIPPPLKASHVALSHRTPSESHHSMSSKRSATVNIARRKPSAHDPNALSPAVAALLAVTAIPPRRPNRYRSKPGSNRRVSIEELISEWKSDGSLKQSFGSPSRAALSILLEDGSDSGEDNGSVPNYLNARSASSDSMPSLDSDSQSVLSVGSPSTPGSLRSRGSFTSLRREKPRSLPASEDCALDHPLIAPVETENAGELLPPLLKQVPVVAKSKSSFKSNLTASLQTLKEAAVNSISSLGRTGPLPSLSRAAAPPMDDMLWSHPFLFPRFSSEVQPAYDGTLTHAQRRYLNPMPLTFEEQEAPFQEALHAPFLAEAVDDAPTIQLQTYNRGRKKPNPKRAPPNPSSEAGRALLGEVGARQREVRENSNFLRVVVLEMNMRREGKLEQGRAKIWLPPRQSSVLPEQHGRVPKRWIGESA